MNLKQLASHEELLTGGHRLCSGCAESVVVRQVLLASDKPVVVANATGCLEVCTTIFPFTAWKVPWIHSAFENAAATIAGVEAAYNALKRRGRVDREINFVAFAGDGGTYDIGLQALSGAVERGHRFLYVCLNNEAYMNTGTQRSSATPLGTWTSTTPAGTAQAGKRQHRKDMTQVLAAHDIPYAAQAIPGRWNDLVRKAEKAYATDGPSFLNVLSPCQRGWGYDPAETMELSRLAVDCCLWPLYEVEHGKYKLNLKPKQKRPITDYLKTQRRFAHLLKPENEAVVAELQAEVDRQWERLLWLCGEGTMPTRGEAPGKGGAEAGQGAE